MGDQLDDPEGKQLGELSNRLDTVEIQLGEIVSAMADRMPRELLDEELAIVRTRLDRLEGIAEKIPAIVQSINARMADLQEKAMTWLAEIRKTLTAWQNIQMVIKQHIAKNEKASESHTKKLDAALLLLRGKKP